jgi:hypothetical protein
MDHVMEPTMVSSQSKQVEINFFEDFNTMQVEKKVDPVVDYDSTVPLVPFTIIPGHHGGLVSEIRI